MRKLLIILVLATGCASVPADVVESVDVLRNNTHKLSINYSALLDRADAPAAPEGESADEQADRLKGWAKHRKHQKMLMSANNTLADKVYEWAVVSAEKTDDTMKEAE